MYLKNKKNRLKNYIYIYKYIKFIIFNRNLNNRICSSIIIAFCPKISRASHSIILASSPMEENLRFLLIVRGKRNKGRNIIVVHTLWPYSHFDTYFLILPHLVRKIKKRSGFYPYRYHTNGNCLRGKWSALLAQ